MAEIKSFRALRFTDEAGDLSSCLCPPYDIIPEKKRLELINRNSNNVIRLELPKLGDDPYAEAARILSSWLDKGILAEDPEEGIYVYEEEFSVKNEVKKIRGMVALIRLEEFSKGIVLPHEETLSKAKEDRFNLMRACGCNFSQIYGMFIDEEKLIKKELDAIALASPENELTTDDGINQRLWICRDKERNERICEILSPKQVYIADGHHRYETAINYRNYLREQGLIQDGEHKANFVMMFLIDIDDPGLVIFPTHRLVVNLDSFDKEAVLQRIASYFDVFHMEGIENMEQTLANHQEKPSFAFYCGDDSYELLVLRDASVLDDLIPDRSEAYRALDVTALHSLILEKAFGIDRENMANQKNLTYTRDLEEAISEVQNKNAACSFILNPTKIRQIRDVAAASDKMPQKSTYFYPKLITGLVMNKLL